MVTSDTHAGRLRSLDRRMTARATSGRQHGAHANTARQHGASTHGSAHLSFSIAHGGDGTMPTIIALLARSWAVVQKLAALTPRIGLRSLLALHCCFAICLFQAIKSRLALHCC